MTTLTFNKDKRNPGFTGNISHEEGLKIAEKLSVPRGKNSPGNHNTGSHWCDADENIMIETGYGVSFNPDVEGLEEKVKTALAHLGYLSEAEVKEEKDLLDDFESLPQELQDLLNSTEEGMDYPQLAELLKKTEALGYTFEYGLDAVPHSLKKLTP